jgi:hypothetical protein
MESGKAFRAMIRIAVRGFSSGGDAGRDDPDRRRRAHSAPATLR